MDTEIDVNGIQDSKNEHITYIGKATKMEDGTWRCLANVAGNLCLVEVNVQPTTQTDELNKVAFCCSFCGKNNKECEVMVAGPTVIICNECVEVAQQCVDDFRAVKNRRVSFKNIIKNNASLGCRCTDCAERNGTGECKCCADRRTEEKNPMPDPVL